MILTTHTWNEISLQTSYATVHLHWFVIKLHRLDPSEIMAIVQNQR